MSEDGSLAERDIPVSGFRHSINYTLDEWREGFAELSLSLDESYINRSGVVHGGVLTSLLDTVGGYSGCYCTVPENIRQCITVSLTASFVGQAKDGRIRATGRVRGGGRRIYYVSSEIVDEAGNVIALGQGVYRYRAGSENPEGVPRGE